MHGIKRSGIGPAMSGPTAVASATAGSKLGTYGYTLIELVAALAVTAVIIAVGFSAYRTYAVRDQVAATLVRSEPLQARVADAFRRFGAPPRDAADAGLPHDATRSLGDDVASVAVTDGRIDIRYADAAHAAIAGETLSLTPFETAGGDVVWVCGDAAPGTGLEPLGFAGGARRAIQTGTTIDPRYLPSACR
jgi:prepilin-type N-terminal cleavage/methylation domain-containing protein